MNLFGNLSRKLSTFTQGKNNNFNLIRLVAAFAVLVAHSFALLKPFILTSEMGLGSIAVDIFFVASGFLVTGSLLLRQSIFEYTLARVLRIYPALIVMLLMTVFLLGAFFTSYPLVSYFANTQIYIYLFKCISLYFDIAYYLPGVFESNPFKGAVNGSLWTLVYEVEMYIFLAMFWLVSGLAKHNRTKIFKCLIVLSAAISAVLVFVHRFYLGDEDNAVRLYFMFFSGAAYWVLRDHIKLLTPVFWLVCAVLLISLYFNQQVFFVVYQLSIAYVLFYLAYVPAGWIRRYNKLGDYSYGVYIYAFPVQQAVIALIPGISAWELMFISGAITLLLAIFSWYLIEKRALRYKEFFLIRSRQLSAA